MTKMFPERIEDTGERNECLKEVFQFFQEAARPEEDVVCWQSPRIGGSGDDPDFVLFGRYIGILVLEVRDWTIQQIDSYTPHHFTLRESEKIVREINPDKKARKCAEVLNNRISSGAKERSDGPGIGTPPGIPVGTMVAFPRIGRKAYSERGLHWMIPGERVLFKEDLEPGSELLSDISGHAFQSRLSAAMPFPLKGLGRNAFIELVSILSPEPLLQIPTRQGEGKSRFQTEVRIMDHVQAGTARRLGHGPHLIKGPPGSGKTLILVHRAYHLRRYNPRMKRVLVVCYNIALVNYLKRLIQEQGGGIGDKGIIVFHFYELCSKILAKPVRYENEDKTYYDAVIRECLGRMAGEGQGYYDAVLVDEGQDFSREMMKTVLAALKPGGELTISLDAHQDLYQRDFSWRSLGIEARGRMRRLRKVYRNTREIFDFTRCFLGRTERKEKQMALLPDDFDFRGNPPEVIPVPSAREIETYLARDIARGVGQGEYKRSEIAVIYDDKIYRGDRFDYDNRAVPMRILEELRAWNIPATWVSRDVASKEDYDPTENQVSLISIHSSKGLDFDLVYLIGADHIHPTARNRDRLLSLLYVAMTRAKYRLVIPYVEETDLIRRMKDCLLTMKRNRL